MALHCAVSREGLVLARLPAGLAGTLPALNLLVLSGALQHSLLRDGTEPPTQVIVISRCEKRDLFLTTRLPQSSLVAVPM